MLSHLLQEHHGDHKPHSICSSGKLFHHNDLASKFFPLITGKDIKCSFLPKKKENTYFVLIGHLNSSFIGKKKNTLTAHCSNTVQGFFSFLWETGSLTGCTHRLIKQSVTDIYSTLKPNIGLYYFTSSSNTESCTDLV